MLNLSICEFAFIFGPAPRIGLLGFSQGGWVIPRVANEVRPAFSVIVGGAVNWRRQGVYLTRQRMQREGAAPDRIAARIAAELKSNDAIFGRPGARADPRARPDIEPRRFGFIARNYAEDASRALATMQGPVLAVWGGQDRNVDPVDDANAYSRAFGSRADRRIVMVPDATHALLRALVRLSARIRLAGVEEAHVHGSRAPRILAGRARHDRRLDQHAVNPRRLACAPADNRATDRRLLQYSAHFRHGVAHEARRRFSPSAAPAYAPAPHQGDTGCFRGSNGACRPFLSRTPSPRPTGFSHSSGRAREARAAGCS
ncbi:alpha/beta hydrolase family protein [Burkholderia ubonensis]|uniref:alpha/beta hydrolase family protein n=1 Tax=Burkholderia ubonensis TaxID=101571 RepID=UPI000AF141FC|nr:hypothetical protein [Burkholderia ubonensis]